uniref:Uncharacterized protein n=1 Tax=Candidatus Methanogaster sp. ANME-2c ERB4 TaxID=2759911 RepID=A0A7G9Y6A3_9EURY|nr:hypothetical protein HMEJMANM_00006 [Methanosarcinales archaeon ANME-2c ERB4]QNO43588.1 hypothetical protein MNENOFAE_00007 [Methanosarcinales archaeon ANME-2c ERB4]QNO50315.1 hypothetical protein CCHAJIPP_00003 [Methanosarcinales archaeon ANME-2c ERB4]
MSLRQSGTHPAAGLHISKMTATEAIAGIDVYHAKHQTSACADVPDVNPVDMQILRIPYRYPIRAKNIWIVS